MSPVLDLIQRQARSRPAAPALVGDGVALSYRDLMREVADARRLLKASGPRPLALAVGNSPAWVVADLACLAVQRAVLPLPAFFSRGQVHHALRDSGAGFLLTDQPQHWLPLAESAGLAPRADGQALVGGRLLHRYRLDGATDSLIPLETAKLTYTSGTSGEPRGVCLSAGALEQVALSLLDACQVQPDDRHLATLPLTTLLENLGGAYVPLMGGACSVVTDLDEVGISGVTGVNGRRMLAALGAFEATSTTLVPQTLTALLGAIEADPTAPRRLRFVAVGGAPVPASLVDRAAALGVPVYQGYGLTECCSVVALNTPAANRPGSAGKPLPHARVEISPSGEVLVSGALMLGYTGEPRRPHGGSYATGDLGRLDADGYLHVTGRARNCYITSFGRNVSPEWVEGELTARPAIAQAVVFGEGRPASVAVLYPRAGADEQAVRRAVDAANQELPEYARVRAWIRSETPFTPANGLLTPNGRPRRERIEAALGESIERLYDQIEETAHGLL